jgi:hypothetical protein
MVRLRRKRKASRHKVVVRMRVVVMKRWVVGVRRESRL